MLTAHLVYSPPSPGSKHFFTEPGLLEWKTGISNHNLMLGVKTFLH